MGNGAPPPPQPRSGPGPWAVAFWGTVALAVVALLVVVSVLSERPDGPDFDTAIRDGASCAELFEIRNRETNGQTIERMNQRLRNIGCHSSTSTRDG